MLTLDDLDGGGLQSTGGCLIDARVLMGVVTGGCLRGERVGVALHYF